jgi:hypothetical protein
MKRNVLIWTLILSFGNVGVAQAKGLWPDFKKAVDAAVAAVKKSEAEAEAKTKIEAEISKHIIIGIK